MTTIKEAAMLIVQDLCLDTHALEVMRTRQQFVKNRAEMEL